MSKETNYRQVSTSAGHDQMHTALDELTTSIDKEVESLINEPGVTIVGFSHSLARDPGTGDWVGSGIIIHAREV